MSVSIWYKREGAAPEVVDRAPSRGKAADLAMEYALAFGTLPRQHRFGKDKVWAGRRDEEPKIEERR